MLQRQSQGSNPNHGAKPMVEGNHSIQLQTSITTASFVLAQFRARNVVKDKLKRQGRRLADFEAREITALANEYLRQHPELVANARPIVESWIKQGRFGKRAQKAFIKQSKIEQTQVERSVANG